MVPKENVKIIKQEIAFLVSVIGVECEGVSVVWLVWSVVWAAHLAQEGSSFVLLKGIAKVFGSKSALFN